MREDATLYSPAEFLTVYFLGTYTSPVAASNLKPRRMAASALFSEAPERRTGGMASAACLLHIGIILSMSLAPAGRSRRGARNLRYVTQPVAGLHR